MRLFEVAINTRDMDAVARTKHMNILVSYWFAFKMVKRMEELRGRFFFLDSGAHSADTQGITIDIDKYMGFINDHRDLINLYAGLDDIGSAERTADNQRIMEEAGFDPLPTFHYGEPIPVLESYLERYNHVCLGGVVGKSRQTKVRWLDTLYARVISRYRTRRIHMFGVSDRRILCRYPFYSCDSSSNSFQSCIGVWPMLDGSGTTCRGLVDKCQDDITAITAAKIDANPELTASQKTAHRFIRALGYRQEMEREITDLWRARGVIWDD